MKTSTWTVVGFAAGCVCGALLIAFLPDIFTALAWREALLVLSGFTVGALAFLPWRTVMKVWVQRWSKDPDTKGPREMPAKTDPELFAEPHRRRADLLLEHYRTAVARYRLFSNSNHFRYMAVQSCAILAGALSPVAAAWPSTNQELAKWLAAALGALASLLTTANATFGWREEFARQTGASEALIDEAINLAARAGKYTQSETPSDGEAVDRFAERASEIVMAEVGDWRQKLTKLAGR